MLKNRMVSWFSVLLLALGLIWINVNASATRQAQPAALANGLSVVLNEVMPKPAPGAPAWLELYVGQEQTFVYLPVIDQNVIHADSMHGSPVLDAGIHFTIPAAIDLRGWQISNEAGQVYAIPNDLPPLPKNVYVLVTFDGSGPAGNDYDFSDGKVTLHTPPGLLDIFPDRSGQVALHRPGTLGAATIVDFVAWGGYSESGGASAAAAGLWGPGGAVSFENGFGDISDEDILARNELIGRFPGAKGHGVLNWANYPEASLTPGSANPIQPVLFSTPENGAKVDAATLSLSWRQSSGAHQYRFQLDNHSDFSSPSIDQIISKPYFKPSPALAEGIYYWRINPLRFGQPGGWTASSMIEVVHLAPTFLSLGSSPLDVTVERVLGIARVAQNKDSRLLGLDGAPEGDPTTDLPENAWDAAAPCTKPPCVDSTKYMHGNMYCVRASIRMVASYYNTSALDVLSMDRISYYVLQEWTSNTRPGSNDSTPDNDLGYNRGMYYPDEEDRAFSWGLNTTYATPGGKPTFTSIKNTIDANQPIMFRRPGHMMVIDGYRETAGGGQFVHVLDPDQPPDFERWQDYSTQTIDGYWVGPAGGPASGTSRTDESSMWTDSDTDGIMNFDEVRRFGLDPYNPDSDGDWVPDKKDMREYVFNNTGAYSFRGSDSDGDSLRKELDADNDADGSPDGCEDTNRNGKYEAGPAETDNFSNGSSQACIPVFDILHPLKSEPVNAGDRTNPQKILVQVSAAVPHGWPLVLTASDFDVTIGSSAASVITVYPAANTYFLVVAPPTQTSSAYFDITVRLSGVGTDDETEAVFYLPKAPNDEVIVLDRSGSMTTNNKIGAAQNAASAFIDFLSDGDWAGVTSFATTASTDYSLHEVTPGSTVRADAIDAINGLAATGSTALGQGMQQGFSLLTGAGHLANDWSLVLLSDGWENVPPYWATVAPGIEKSVIHTVALGSDADTILLQKIAAANYGSYFYVDVNPPLAPDFDSLAPTVALSVPNQLPNRLADAYLSIGELDRGWQRLFQQVLTSNTEYLWVDVPKGTPEVIFGLNWSDPAGQAVILDLLDPDGFSVKPDAVHTRQTHTHWLVRDPKAGQWKVFVRILKQVEGMELFFTLSGKSQTTLIAGIGGDPEKRGTGSTVPIYGILTDEKPIAGASVYALVTNGNSVLLQLYDDGKHADGKAEDGLYANSLDKIAKSGGYSVKLVATGTNNFGDTFTRYAGAGFNVRPRLAYIWKDNLDMALDYAALLQGKYWLVDLIPLSAVSYARLLPAELIILGPDTGTPTAWGTNAAIIAIVESGKPILGLGEGGYSFFGKLKLKIGYPNGAWDPGTAINWANPGDSIWQTPFTFTLLKVPLQLYEKPSVRVSIYLLEVPSEITVFGYNSTNGNYADLLQEQGRYMLWGFNDGPARMTETGRRLFINTVLRSVP